MSQMSENGELLYRKCKFKLSLELSE